MRGRGNDKDVPVGSEKRWVMDACAAILFKKDARTGVIKSGNHFSARGTWTVFYASFLSRIFRRADVKVVLNRKNTFLFLAFAEEVVSCGVSSVTYRIYAHAELNRVMVTEIHLSSPEEFVALRTDLSGSESKDFEWNHFGNQGDNTLC